jgi:hypothetical protein
MELFMEPGKAASNCHSGSPRAESEVELRGDRERRSEEDLDDEGSDDDRDEDGGCREMCISASCPPAARRMLSVPAIGRFAIVFGTKVRSASGCGPWGFGVSRRSTGYAVGNRAHRCRVIDIVLDDGLILHVIDDPAFSGTYDKIPQLPSASFVNT